MTLEPYRGPEEFRFIDRPIFPGRDREIRELVQLIIIYKGTMLYGGSGAGKSSLVNAGLMPELARRGFRVDSLRVQPIQDAEFSVQPLFTGETDTPAPDSSFGTRQNAAIGIAAKDLKQRLSVASPGGRILIFDQFEEMVTLFSGAERSEMRRLIVDALLEIYYGPYSVKLLLVFRDDYLAPVRSLLASLPEWIQQSIWLRPPGKERAFEIIAAPFKSEIRFSRVLSGALMNQVAEDLKRASGDDLNLTDLQVACLTLWRAAKPEEKFASGGVKGLIEQYLEDALAALGRPEERDAAIALLSTMITSVGTRNIISEADAIEKASSEPGVSVEACRQALESLVRTRLVRVHKQYDTPYYEVVSEYIIPWIVAKRREKEARRIDDQVRQQAAQELQTGRQTIEADLARRTRRVLIAGTVGLFFLALLIAYLFQVRQSSAQRKQIAELSTEVQRLQGEKKTADQTIQLLIAREALGRAARGQRAQSGSGGLHLVGAVCATLILLLGFSLLCAACVEAWTRFAEARARYLRKSINKLLGDESLAEQLYSHPLIRSGAHGSEISYIPPRAFAIALVDILRPSTEYFSPLELRNTLFQINTFLARSLAPIAETASDVQSLIAGIENWFNAAMQGVSTAFKKRTQARIAAVAFLLTMAVNIDALAILESFSQDPVLRASVASTAAEVAMMQAQGTSAAGLTAFVTPIETLSIPIGWSKEHALSFRGFVQHVPGWMVSLFLITLGAPFCFDVVARFSNIRSDVRPARR